MTESTSQSENTKDVIFKVVLPSYYTQFFDKVKPENIPGEIDIFGSLSFNTRFERDGIFYSLGKCDRTEETFIKNYGNIDCESVIRRVTIVVEKYDDKVSIKVFDYTKKRRFGGKYFKNSPSCSYLTYNKKTNDLYHGTTSKIKRTRTSTIKRNRFENVRTFYKMLHATCEGVKSVYYSQTDPICSDELIRSVISAKNLSWNKFLAEINSEFFKQNFYLNEDEKFFKYYLVNRNIKYPDNFINFLPLNRISSRLLKKSGNKLIDGIMLKYNISGKKFKRVLHNISSPMQTYALESFQSVFGNDMIKKLSDNQLKKLLEMSYFGLSNDTYGLNFILKNGSKKEVDNFIKVVINENIENKTIDAVTLIDHLRFYKFLKQDMELDVEWKANDLKSFREEHVEFSTEYAKFKNVLSINRKYDEKFKQRVDRVFEYNGEKYYPVLLEENKDYIMESVVQSNCVRTYVESTSFIISFRVGSLESDNRASLEYKLTKINNRLRLNRTQSKIRYNQVLPDELEIACQVFDSYLNTLMDNFKKPKLIKEKAYGDEEFSLHEENGSFTWEKNKATDLPF